MSDLPSRSQAGQALHGVLGYFIDDTELPTAVRDELNTLITTARAYVDGRLIDRTTINYEAAMRLLMRRLPHPRWEALAQEVSHLDKIAGLLADLLALELAKTGSVSRVQAGELRRAVVERAALGEDT